jgi:hypothetical protein
MDAMIEIAVAVTAGLWSWEKFHRSASDINGGATTDLLSPSDDDSRTSGLS